MGMRSFILFTKYLVTSKFIGIKPIKSPYDILKTLQMNQDDKNPITLNFLLYVKEMFWNNM